VSLKVTRKDESGRVTEMLLQGQLPQPVPGTPGEAAPVSWIPVEKRLPGWSIRRAVGTLRIKSTLFRLDQPNPGVFRFTGRGFGHGLGLCQIGADARAKAGQSYRQILAHYYPGSRVGPLAAPAR